MRFALLGMLPAFVVAAPDAGMPADVQTFHITIAASDLKAALRELARQTGLQIAHFSEPGTSDAVVGPLSGDMTRSQALERLLAGTAQTYRFLNDHTVAIVRRPPAPASPAGSGGHGSDSSATSPPAGPDPRAHRETTTEPATTDTGGRTVSSKGLFARLGALLGICVAAPGVVCAQQPAGAAAAGLEEIVVTAQKREESVQDIPIAITAVSASDLEALGITKPRNIDAVVPNMRWIGNDGTGVSSVYIRGVGDFSFHSNQVGAVGLYMDEVSLNSPYLASFGMFDMQRVEVLRGPQNTIFGRNTTGGAIQFVTQKPSVDGFNAHGSISAGNYGRFDVDAAINLPASDSVAVRLAAARYQLGDYLDNIVLDRGEGAYHRTAGRAQLLWKPTADVDALFGVNAGQSSGGFTGYKQIGLGTVDDPGAVQCPANLVNAVPGNGCVDQTGYADSADFSKVSTNGVNRLEIKARGANARLDWRLPGYTITSLTAYEHSEGQRAEDSSGGPSYIFNFMQSSAANQFSEELRAASSGEGRLRWIGGLYYFNENAHWTTLANRANQALTNVTVPGLPVPATDWYAFIPFTMTNQKDEVYSAYGQLEFKFDERFRLTTGLRFTSEHKSGRVKNGIVTRTDAPVDPFEFVDAALIDSLLVGATEVPAGSSLRVACPKPLPFTQCVAYTPFDLKNNSVGGKVSLDMRLSDAMLAYASVSRGFKAGGISIGALDYVARGGSRVAPEYLWTYEVGMKTEMLDRTLRVNAAVFDNQWQDEQLFLVLNTPPTGLNPVYTNVPKTESYGLEAEIEWAPTADWYLRNSVGLLHSSVKSINADLAASGGAKVGSVLIASPKVTWNGMIRKQWPIGRGRFSLATDWSYTGSQHFDLVDTPDLIEGAYWLWNANAGYQFGDKTQYELSLWGKNLSDSQYCTMRLSSSGVVFGNIDECAPNEARRFFGISLRGSF